MKTKNKFNYSKLFTCMLLSGSYAISNTAIAADDAAAETETIEITGFRSSLNAALMSKRDAVGSRDVILAEDIGKFPDLNVADSLARVPGISMEEDGGEGRQITIRGLGSRFVKTTINGMESASAGSGSDAGGGSNKSRAFDFNVFASELFTEVTVDKSPSAELEDGGIGGNVNLQAAKPFQYQGTKIAYNVNARYNDIAAETTPRVSFMASKNFDNKFGILGSVSYSKGVVQSEGSTSVRWTVLNPHHNGVKGDTDAYGDPNLLIEPPKTVLDGEKNGIYNDDYLNGKYIPRIPRYSIYSQEKSRLGITGALQYAPTEDLTMGLDWLHAKLETDVNEYQYSVLMRDNKGTSPAIYPENLVHDANGNIVAGAFSNAPIRSEARKDNSESTFNQLSFNSDWYITDRLRMKFLVGAGTSELDVPYQNTFAIDANNSVVAYSYDSSVDPMDLINNQGNMTTTGSMNTDMPAFAFIPAQPQFEHGSYSGGNYTLEQSKNAMSDGNNYDVALTRTASQTIESENSSLKLDFAYELTDEVTLKWGYNSRSFETEQHYYRNYYKRLKVTDTTDDAYKAPNDPKASTTGNRAETWAVDHFDEYAGISLDGSKFATTLDKLGIEFGNSVSVPASSAITQSTWLAADFDKMMAAFGNQEFMQRRERFDQTYKLKEEVDALYFQTDFNGEVAGFDVRANIGFRYLDNKNTSSIANKDHYNKNTLLAYWGEGANYASGYGWVTTVSESNNFLPSLNIAVDLTEDLVGRFSASKAITRPALKDLASSVSISEPSISSETGEESAGSIKVGAGPSLKPYEATQFDIGLEWYFDAEALLGAVVFYKDISGLTKQTENTTLERSFLENLNVDVDGNSLIQDDTIWSVQSLKNTPAEGMWGYELIYQQPFTFLPGPFDGFGISANYTYIDYTRDVEDPFTNEILNLVEEETSKNTINTTLYYEGDDFSARVSYNFREGYNKEYRNEYKDEGTFVRGYDDKGVWKFSSRYKLSNDMSVSFEVINLTNSEKKQWGNIYNKQPMEYFVNGRQFLLGLRGTL
ncbi:TonB-dependent receptor [Catenovulum maritimum]|uniref:TonB-dependent receptor n=1 Tax=Catenovulum maritimum TaxID=1513271 RepID=A0A0J8GLT3_9ALTE|nr:TonB-dependent receptor [Catenovulum maritimum]KMT63755.1 TonB-dependent receptor [Catenovulum maritimum]